MKGSPRHDPLDEAPRDLYTVTEISEAVKQHLESEFPQVSIIGEIANYKLHTSGHAYFTLRDDTNILHAVLFRRYASALAFTPENGMLAIAAGRISHFGGSGQTQIIATDLIPAGHGSMEIEFRRLLQRLMDEGLTASERKRKIPPYPRRIAVITSPTGAVIKDILDTLARRWPVAGVLHLCAEVQGPAAARSIVRAFETANRIDGIDTVILARGGGNIEDLWTFNGEEVARAVAGSAHPVITGIGHEIDTTVVDYVSDLRAATPTAAAELATPLIGSVRRDLGERERMIASRCAASIEGRSRLVEYLARSAAFPAIAHRMEMAELGIDSRLERLSAWWETRRNEDQRALASLREDVVRSRAENGAIRESMLDDAAGRLAAGSPAMAVRLSEESLEHLSRFLRLRVSTGLSLRRRELAGKTASLGELDPRGILARGYAYCTSPDGRIVIPRVARISPGDEMAVRFHDGSALCTVAEKRKGKPWRKR